MENTIVDTKMSHHKIPTIDQRIRQLFDNTLLTFLVGAGISIDNPSNLVSGPRMMEAIIKYSCPLEEVSQILAIPNLRFEQVVEIVRDTLDENLEIINYYGQCESPNLLHFFLASRLLQGDFVMTTNFDFLLEYALRLSGVADSEILPIITKVDYEKYQHPQELWEQGKKLVVKIHGSTKNVMTGENTEKFLVTTIQDFGSNKAGVNVFQLEPYKRNLFHNITQNRTLVVMGYSGSDDFDIVPTLKVLPKLKGVIWINHDQNSTGSGNFKVISNTSVKFRDKVDQILIELGKMHPNIPIFRIDVNTTALVQNLWSDFPSYTLNPFSITPESWISAKLQVPSLLRSYFVSYRIYEDLSLIKKAMKCAKFMLKTAKETKDSVWESLALNNIGMILMNRGDLDQALEYFHQSLTIEDQLDDPEEKAIRLNNIGMALDKQGNMDQALKNYFQALAIKENLGDFKGMETTLSNVGKILQAQGKLDKSMDYYSQALSIAEQRGELHRKATILNNIGSVFHDQWNRDKALDYYRQALAIHKHLGNLKGEATTLNNIGLLLYQKGQIKNALTHVEKAAEIKNQLGLPDDTEREGIEMCQKQLEKST
jgi:tetratricopeptide (TPR) repeat protein